MAIDPALVGFDAVNTLQDTLLNYVMQNRMMQARDRQFNTQMQLERDRFEEDRRRYDTNFLEDQKRYDTDLGFKKRDESRLIKDRADYKLKEKAGADTFRDIQSIEKQKADIAKYDRDFIEFKNKYRLPHGLMDYIPGFRKRSDKNLKLAFEQGAEQNPAWMRGITHYQEPKDYQWKSYGVRPELKVPELGNYNFVPQYAPELLEAQKLYNTENLLNIRNESMLNNILNK